MTGRLGVALALLLASASPAAAFLVEVTTSVAVENAGDQRACRRRWPARWTAF